MDARTASQWSLTFEVRKSRQKKATPPRRHGSQWSLTFEVRKSRGGGSLCGGTLKSQWSLTFEVRKSPSTPFYGIGSNTVAMEPDL